VVCNGNGTHQTDVLRQAYVELFDFVLSLSVLNPFAFVKLSWCYVALAWPPECPVLWLHLPHRFETQSPSLALVYKLIN
jgi:hypothetical protein